MIDTSAVLVGAPDTSLSVGFVCMADVDATMPETAVDALSTSTWTDCGDVSEDGIALATSYGTEAVKDWDLVTIRTLLTDFEGSVECTFVTTKLATLQTLYGESNVTYTAATASHGAQISVAMGAELPERKAYCFNMLDGDNAIRVVLPNAQAIPNGNLEFKKGGILTWPVKFDAGADASGKSIYILTDDGVVSA